MGVGDRQRRSQESLRIARRPRDLFVREDDRALVSNVRMRACYVASLRLGFPESNLPNGGTATRRRLTLELVTVGDFALPVAGLFVQVKGQSAGTRDLLQAGPCTPNRSRTEKQRVPA